MTIANPINALVPPSGGTSRARALRPAYFQRLDALLASGAFTIEDRRTTYRPTGRLYAD